MPAGFTVSASFPVATAAPAPPIAVARGRSTHTGHGAPESLTLFWARAAVATASKATKTTRMRAKFMTPRRGSPEKGADRTSASDRSVIFAAPLGGRGRPRIHGDGQGH